MRGSRKKTAGRKPARRARRSKAPAVASPSPRIVPIRSGEIRWSKVMTAHARMSNGYYDREDVRDVLIDALIRAIARH